MDMQESLTMTTDDEGERLAAGWQHGKQRHLGVAREGCNFAGLLPVDSLCRTYPKPSPSGSVVPCLGDWMKLPGSILIYGHFIQL